MPNLNHTKYCRYKGSIYQIFEESDDMVTIKHRADGRARDEIPLKWIPADFLKVPIDNLDTLWCFDKQEKTLAVIHGKPKVPVKPNRDYMIGNYASYRGNIYAMDSYSKSKFGDDEIKLYSSEIYAILYGFYWDDRSSFYADVTLADLDYVFSAKTFCIYANQLCEVLYRNRYNELKLRIENVSEQTREALEKHNFYTQYDSTVMEGCVDESLITQIWATVCPIADLGHYQNPSKQLHLTNTISIHEVLSESDAKKLFAEKTAQLIPSV